MNAQKRRVKEQGPGREGKVGKSICNIKKLMATVNVSLPQPFKYAKFRYLFESICLQTPTKQILPDRRKEGFRTSDC
jgi:hypothetical protein